MATKVTTDPESYSGGYVPAWAVQDDGKWLFMPLMGHNHSPETNNAVRVFDPSTGKWTYWQQDIAGQLTREEWFAGEKQTDPPSASGRNNLWGWYLPWRNWLIIGAPGNSLAGNHGVYDLQQKAWTHLVPNGSRHKAIPGIQYESEDAKAGLSIWNAADATCDALKTLVRYGGKNDGILILIEEQDDGSFLASRYNNQLPGKRNSVQQQGVCRGEYFYLAGGTKKYQGEPLAEFWRVHIPSRQWERMADLPAPVAGGAILLHDTDLDRFVCIANDGTSTAYAYDPNADVWSDVTDLLALPQPQRAAGAYVPGHGVFLRGGMFNGGNWTTSRNVYRASLGDVADIPQPDEPVDEPEPEPTPEPEPEPEPADPKLSVTLTGGMAHVEVAGTVVSDHMQYKEAVESATNHALAGEHDVRITVDDTKVELQGVPEQPTEEPAPEPEPTPSGDLKVTRLEALASGQGPRGNMKHLSFEPGPDGRVYVFGGDWTADPGASYRRELWSAIPSSQDWRLESGYCPPDADTPWPKGACQAGLTHMGNGEFLIVGGNWMNGSDYCGFVPKSGYVLRRHADGAYSIPEQSPAGGYDGGAYGQTKYGVWDDVNQRFLAIKGHSTIVQFKDGVWSRPSGEPSGSYLWSAQGNQNIHNRLWYMTNEKDDGLYVFDLDTDELRRVADLPWPARENGEGYEQVATCWWGNKLVLMRLYDPDTFTFYDPSSNTFEQKPLPSECIGNHLVPDPKGIVVFGRNDASWGDANYFTRPHWLVEMAV